MLGSAGRAAGIPELRRGHRGGQKEQSHRNRATITALAKGTQRALQDGTPGRSSGPVTSRGGGIAPGKGDMALERTSWVWDGSD